MANKVCKPYRVKHTYVNKRPIKQRIHARTLYKLEKSKVDINKYITGVLKDKKRGLKLNTEHTYSKKGRHVKVEEVDGKFVLRHYKLDKKGNSVLL